MDKNRVVCHKGWFDAAEYLTDEEFGMLFKAVGRYAFDGEDTDFGEIHPGGDGATPGGGEAARAAGNELAVAWAVIRPMIPT